MLGCVFENDSLRQKLEQSRQPVNHYGFNYKKSINYHMEIDSMNTVKNKEHAFQ
jgi:hypothetical protein